MASLGNVHSKDRCPGCFEPMVLMGRSEVRCDACGSKWDMELLQEECNGGFPGYGHRAALRPARWLFASTVVLAVTALYSPYPGSFTVAAVAAALGWLHWMNLARQSHAYDMVPAWLLSHGGSVLLIALIAATCRGLWIERALTGDVKRLIVLTSIALLLVVVGRALGRRRIGVSVRRYLAIVARVDEPPPSPIRSTLR